MLDKTANVAPIYLTNAARSSYILDKRRRPAAGWQVDKEKFEGEILGAGEAQIFDFVKW